MSKEITSRQEDYAQWYNDLVIKGGLAVIQPSGMYGDQTLWICALGRNAGYAGPDV
jgi:hypothetical protein